MLDRVEGQVELGDHPARAQHRQDGRDPAPRAVVEGDDDRPVREREAVVPVGRQVARQDRRVAVGLQPVELGLERGGDHVVGDELALRRGRPLGEVRRRRLDPVVVQDRHLDRAARSGHARAGPAPAGARRFRRVASGVGAHRRGHGRGHRLDVGLARPSRARHGRSRRCPPRSPSSARRPWRPAGHDDRAPEGPGVGGARWSSFDTNLDSANPRPTRARRAWEGPVVRRLRRRPSGPGPDGSARPPGAGRTPDRSPAYRLTPASVARRYIRPPGPVLPLPGASRILRVRGHDRTRLLRDPRRRADRVRRRDQARVPQARPAVAPGRQHRPGGAGAVQGDQRGLPGPVRPGSAPRYDMFGRAGVDGGGGGRRRVRGLRRLLRHLRRLLRWRRRARPRRGAAGRSPARTCATTCGSPSRRPSAAPRRRSSSPSSSAARRATAAAPSRAPRRSPARSATAAARSARSARRCSARWSTSAPARAATARARSSRRRARRAAATAAPSASGRSG